jgi:PH (Pleckstrin Homology) domain-containing protein
LTVRFRHHSGIAIAGAIATVGALPFATARWYLTPVLLVPAAVAVWGWRAGTDADETGVTVRALLGRRRLPWDRIRGLVPSGRRVVAVLDGGATVPLTAVTPADLPKLVAASGSAPGNP